MDSSIITEELECPVCFQTPRNPPIFQCENGHLICCICHPKLKKCPQGQCDLGSRRCRLAETLLEKSNIPRPCVYSPVGCIHEDLMEKLPNHEVVCSFRKVNCPDQDCGDVLLEKDVLTHLEDEHFLEGLVTKEQAEKVHEDRVRSQPTTTQVVNEVSVDHCLWIVEDEDLRVRSINRTWSPSFFRYQGQAFFSILKKVRHTNLWYAWIYVMGPQKLASKFQCSIAAHNKARSIWHSYSGPVQTLDTSGESVVASANCLVLTDEIVSLLLSELPVQQKSHDHNEDGLRFLLEIEYRITSDLDQH